MNCNDIKIGSYYWIKYEYTSYANSNDGEKTITSDLVYIRDKGPDYIEAHELDYEYNVDFDKIIDFVEVINPWAHKEIAEVHGIPINTLLPIAGSIEERIIATILQQVSGDGIVTLESTMDSLGLDSLDAVELIMALEDEFNLDEITDSEAEKIVTVADAVKLIESKVNGNE